MEPGGHEGHETTSRAAPIVTVHFDGACRRTKEGLVATYGFVVEGASLDHEGKGLAVPVGSESATNNVAEYVAAIRALEFLRTRGYHGPVDLVGDSELVLRQMSGQYRVRAAHLTALHDELRAHLATFASVRLRHVRREENRRADALSHLAFTEWRRGRGR